MTQHKGNNRLTLLLLTLLTHVHAEEPEMEAPMEVAMFNRHMYATCEVTPDPNLPAGQPEIYGQIFFRQFFPAGTVQAIVNLHGLPIDDQQKRAIHIHQYGDVSQGFTTAGPHYNPLGVDHPSHPGDMGNFVSSNGVIRQQLKVEGATLLGGQSILGRAVVIHEKEDDLGLGPNEESKLTGNAGRRIAGCIIGISSNWWLNTVAQLISEVEKKN